MQSDLARCFSHDDSRFSSTCYSLPSQLHGGMTSPLALLKAFVLLLAFLLIPLGFLGLCFLRTWEGLLLSMCLGFFGAGPLLWCIGEERGQPMQQKTGMTLLVLSLIGVTLAIWTAPNGHTVAAERIHTRYSDGGWHYSRSSIGTLMPEIDQIRLGYAAAMTIDPYFDRAQRRELSTMTDAIYAEMEHDSGFRAVGSALPAIYREMSFSEFRDGHYFHYIPASVDRTKPTPALVFVHGSGGNFKAYVWLLSKIADELGITIVAPTFGMGNWEKRGAYDVITRAIADAGKHTAIDPNQIHLMGLSNGGKGVCLAESGAGPRFRSLIYLSAVFHSRIQAESLAARLKHCPFLVISGGNDDRVPWSYVSDYAGRLKSAGLNVTTRLFAADDHFLFFRKRSEVLRMITDWLKTGHKF